jgi:hypothetical protein
MRGFLHGWTVGERRLATALRSLPQVASSDIDWPLARQQGLELYLQHRLGASLCRQATVRLLWRQTLLLRIVSALHKAQIAVAVLKGVPLAMRVYPHASVRRTWDFDLLIRPEELLDAARVLQTVGYRQTGNWDLDIRYHHHVVMTHPAMPPVELHFRPHRALGILWDTAAILQRRQPAGVLPDIDVLSPEDELIHLCVHASANRWRALCLLLDIHLFVQHDPLLDWELLTARAATIGALYPVLHALQAATQIGLELPERFSSGRLRGFCAEWLRTLSLQFSHRRTLLRASDFLHNLCLCDRWGQAARYTYSQLGLFAQ